MRNELRDVGRAVEAALDRLRGLPPREAVAGSEELSQVLNGAVSEAAALRAEAAARLREDGKLSLAQLAEELQISRARAAQLVRAAEAKAGRGGKG